MSVRKSNEIIIRQMKNHNLMTIFKISRKKENLFLWPYRSASIMMSKLITLLKIFAGVLLNLPEKCNKECSKNLTENEDKII